MIKEKISPKELLGKMDNPATPGTAGQVLTSDGTDYSWEGIPKDNSKLDQSSIAPEWSAGTHALGTHVTHKGKYWKALAATSDEPTVLSADWALEDDIDAQIAAIKALIGTSDISKYGADVKNAIVEIGSKADNIADDNDEYNPNHNYVVGEYCISPDDGTLQKCVVATSGGSWATVKDTCFTKDSLTNVVKTLNNDLNKYPEYTVLYEGSKLQGPTTIPGLGYLEDWDELIFVCRANAQEDTYMFTEKLGQRKMPNAPYISFTGWDGDASQSFISTIRFWGGDINILGIGVNSNNANWKLGLITLIGVKYKA